MPKREFIDRNVELARTFKPMTAPEKEQLRGSIVNARKVAMGRYLQGHADA